MKKLYLNGILFLCCLSSKNLESSESSGPECVITTAPRNLGRALDFNIPHNELTPEEQADRADYVNQRSAGIKFISIEGIGRPIAVIRHKATIRQIF
jgi:hypothetical protein